MSIDDEIKRFANLFRKINSQKWQPYETTAFEAMMKLAIKDEQDDVLNTMKECHPFVFSQAEKEDKFSSEQEFNEAAKGYIGEELDLPFRVCSIEVMGEALMPPINIPESRKEKGYMYVDCVVIEEVAPKKYNFCLLVQRFVEISEGEYKSERRLGYIPYSKGDELSHQYSVLVHSLNKYLQKLHQEKIGVAGRNEPIKFRDRRTGKKNFIRPKNITYVSPKKYMSSLQEKIGRHIEWSHRWEVRGHWRRTKGIGKDREGKYCVNGWTWVVPAIKGPQAAPLIKKTRLLNDGEEV